MFTYHLPAKIIFGQPVIDALHATLHELEARRVLLVSDSGLAGLGLVQHIGDSLASAEREIVIFARVQSNPTTDDVDAALSLAREYEIQAIVALGGGSVIDVGKATAMLLANGHSYADYQWGGRPINSHSIPLLAIPTTAGTGSEMSKVAVIIDPQKPFKKGVLSPHMFAHTAILDPELTRSLPPGLTAATGVDALTHALEAYIGQRANPYTDMLALNALEIIWRALPRAVTRGDDMESRSQMMLAAAWAGTAMDHAGLGLIHSLSGPLTSALHLHHGLTNAILLPHVMRFNLPAISAQRRMRLQQLFGLSSEFLPQALARFVQNLGLPQNLADVANIAAVTDWQQIIVDTLRMAMTPNNPRPVTPDAVADLLRVLFDTPPSPEKQHVTD